MLLTRVPKILFCGVPCGTPPDKDPAGLYVGALHTYCVPEGAEAGLTLKVLLLHADDVILGSTVPDPMAFTVTTP